MGSTNTLSSRSLLALLVAAALTGCGADQKDAVPPPEPTASAAATPPPPVETAVASAAPEPTASASAATPPKPPKQSSGRPAVLKQDASEITDTFGSSPGAKLQIGSDKDAAVLKIPEQALRVGTNITFKLNPRGKATGGQVGKIYHVIPWIPPATQPTTVESEGPPFELQFPAGTRKDANLAVGVITVDDKGREKIAWTIYAPKHIDDVTNTAFFELPSLSEAFIHVTTKAPTKK